MPACLQQFAPGTYLHLHPPANSPSAYSILLSTLTYNTTLQLQFQYILLVSKSPIFSHHQTNHIFISFSPYAYTFTVIKPDTGYKTTMESVPETEKLEEFRTAPVPSLRLHHSNYTLQSSTSDHESPRKPPTMRRATDPSPSSPISPTWNAAALPYRPRTTSPLSGNHMRSKSAATLAPPPMGRAQSLPGMNGLGQILIPRPDSPKGSPNRTRTMRKPIDEVYPPASPTRTSVLDSERSLSERNSSPNLAMTPAPIVRHRRPSSPLRYIASSSTGSLPNSMTSTASSITSSPLHKPYDSFNDGYTFSSMYASSSVPSTPISVRSRSPSISSLETIPDSPDAEEAAVEADRIAQLKADAEAEEAGEPKGRSSLDMPSRGRTISGFGIRDKRKRWSVCGAERRGDFDLETIWED